MPATQFRASVRRLKENNVNRPIVETLASGLATLINMQTSKEHTITPTKIAPSLITPAFKKGAENARKALMRLTKYVREGKIMPSKAGGKGLF